MVPGETPGTTPETGVLPRTSAWSLPAFVVPG